MKRRLGDIELLELIAKDPQARILEMIETLDEIRANADYEVLRAAAEKARELAGEMPF